MCELTRPVSWLAVSNSLMSKLDKAAFCANNIDGGCGDLLWFISGSSNEAEINVLALAKTSLNK